ncbi:hypothetical protein [Nocardia brasiliensis]|uniref:hypothetical protein n=1 Tax=Nocardia brasiliensis TaxID=37326 RepID=UPI002456CFD9|nr:hypothetical protein [Nocardia brasiliensis]
MSNALAPVADTGLALAPVGTPAAAIAMLQAHAEMMVTAHQLASAMVNTAMVPQIYRGKPDDATAAILYGAELGLNPIQSLQQVFPVHGQPSIYAKTMVALLKARGYKFDTPEKSDEKVTFTGTSPDGSETETSTWTIERAIKAKYVPTIDEKTGKYKTNANGKLLGNEKYLTDPEGMLWAKAAATVCKRLAPDVLLGISDARESLESEQDATPATVHVRSERVSAADILGETTPPTVAPEDVQPVPDSPEVEEPAAAGEPVEEAPAPPAEPMSTTAQQRKLAILLGEHGVAEREDKLAYLGEQFKRTFASSKELTRTEAAQLIEFLSRPIEDGEQATETEGGDR